MSWIDDNRHPFSASIFGSVPLFVVECLFFERIATTIDVIKVAKLHEDVGIAAALSA
jgi:hypothetical protein